MDDDYTDYTQDEELNGMPRDEREELLKSRKRRKIFTIALIAIIIIALLVAIVGLVIIVNVNSDDDKGPSNSNYSASPTPSNSTSVSLSITSSPSITPSPSIVNGNQGNKDINENYYKNIEAHAFTIDDLTRTDRISEPVTSPDDQHVVFIRYVYNPSTNITSSTLWLQNLQTFEQVQLTPFGWSISESNPCWSSDSMSILFISNRDPNNIYWPGNSYQVWQILASYNNDTLPQVVSNYSMDVTALMCSPQGKYFTFAANVIPGYSLDESASIIAQKESESVRAFTFDKLFIRHWGEWYHGERSHVFLQSITWSSNICTISGNPIDILGNMDTDVPSKPFGGIEEWSFAPDDSEFAFTRRYDEYSSVAWTTNLDIFTVSISESGELGPLICITEDNTAADTQPSYSPDGNKIAYLSQTVPGYESDRYMVKLYDRNSSIITKVSNDWDRSIDSLVWLLDNTGFYVTIDEYAREKIYYLSTSGAYSVVVDDHAASSLNVLTNSSIVFSYESMVEPANIFMSSSHGNLTQLTTFNNLMLSKTYRSTPMEFWFTGAHNDQVHGWILNATQDSREGNPSQYPIAFLIHGGPQGTWSDDWSYRWNPQTYTGHGYAVVMIDFHGSTGYGQNFTNSITNDYGGAPFYDLNVGLDYVINNTDIYPFIDSSRLVALGASYGGWMINWINGHQWQGVDRFLCLVCHDGIFDERIFWFDTDELWFPEHDMIGTPFNTSNYNTWNPSLFSGQWSTPQLVIHGGRDYRIPDSHGIGAFTALQRRGIDSKFVFFPTENHWVQTPSNSVYWHHTVEDWIDHYAYPSN